MKYLRPYNEFANSILEDFVDAVLSQELKCYASDFVEDFDLENISINEAITRAVRACVSMKISPSRHFRKIYIHTDECVYIDWRLSPYGCYLMLVNYDPSHPLIAKFQSSLIIGN